MNGHRRDVEDAEARYPREREEDGQEKQHETPSGSSQTPDVALRRDGNLRQGMTYNLATAEDRTRPDSRIGKGGTPSTAAAALPARRGGQREP
jgi:hypothetical protein